MKYFLRRAIKNALTERRKTPDPQPITAAELRYRIWADAAVMAREHRRPPWPFRLLPDPWGWRAMALLGFALLTVALLAGEPFCAPPLPARGC